MIRTLLAILATLTLCLTLAGCEGGGHEDDPEGVGVRREPPAQPRTPPGPAGGAVEASEDPSGQPGADEPDGG